jgi:two-component system probable response regulator PhcQ
MTAPQNSPKYAVLYVDDEEQALKYFRKIMERDFRVLTATSVADALVILEREASSIGVVITDQRMPGQYGVELLKKLRVKWPAIIRLLITAYSDIESAIDSVNAGAIYKYVTKPCDLKQLKQTITDAMALFLANADREVLLNERLDVMQRMMVADRVRSLATMAGGISHHLRNSMTAMSCFLEEMTPSKPGESPGAMIANDPKFAEQLWSLAQKEREHLLHIVQSVGQSVAEPSLKLNDDLDAAALIDRGIAALGAGCRKPVVRIDPAAPRVKVDAEAAARLLRILLTYATRLSRADGTVSIAAEPMDVGGAPSISVKITGEGLAWSDEDVASFFTPFAFPSNDPSDLGLDMLSAFSLAYHHGGDIVVHPAPPAGPGFELRLPACPADVRRPGLQDGMLPKLFTSGPDQPAGGRTSGGQAA